jgi:putative phosphoribosyl transferase
MRFRDRAEAGRVLAGHLGRYAGRSDLVILALPRGGVPVAVEVARVLHAPLDVFVVRKLGLPAQPELAMGAIASGGVRVLNDEVIADLGVPPAVIDQVAATEERELRRRERQYRGDLPAPDIEGRTVILVDDGLATGSTMRAAALAVRRLRPVGVVIAVPVAPASTCEALRADADEVICAMTPPLFSAVGLWYDDFAQTPDAEVRDLLEASRRRQTNPQAPSDGHGRP